MPKTENGFSEGEDPRSKMIYAHGNKALDQIKELDMPTVMFVFDVEQGEIHACSYKMENLTSVQRQLFVTAALAYADAPLDVPTSDEKEAA